MISIIVPVYNSSENLETCLLTLVNQTKKDIEIIVIDDASTDNSKEIIKKFAQKYPTIKVHYNEKNLGVGATRNIGMDLASGEYIGFVDSDDYVSLTMYEFMYDAAKLHKFPDMIETRLKFVKNNEYALNNLSYASTKNSFPIANKKAAMFDFSPSVCNKLFKKELIDNYKFLENCKWEDIAFTYSMYIKAEKIIRLNNSDYFYRRSIENGVSSINYQANDKILEIFRVTDEIINFANKLGKLDEYKTEIYLICFTAVFGRISELECWECSNEQKQYLKNKIYRLLYTKYGMLNCDIALLSSRNSLDIIEEYQNFCNNLENSKTK